MSFALRIGTRGSPLALAQAALVARALREAHGLADYALRIVPVKTTGDRVQDRPLAEIGGKALWTKELDRALADGEIDCAVHSMKDVETIRPAVIKLVATLPRADARDRLIGAPSIDALPEGARIGTSSPRRAAQLLRLRPDLSIDTLRGNVATRLAAIANRQFDATLLAAAGLDRLGHRDIGAPIAPDILLPAPQQGAVGVECLAANTDVAEAISAIDHDATHRCIRAERALLEALGADCHSPVAALATIDGDAMILRAQLLTNDGSQSVGGDMHCPVATGEGEAAALAERLLRDAGPAIRTLFAGEQAT